MDIIKYTPELITESHVRQAIHEIEQQGISLEPSNIYDVIIDGKPYPPKEVMRYALLALNKMPIVKTKQSAFENFNAGERTNKWLRESGFEIKQKQTSNKSYWIGGSFWKGYDQEDQTARFLEEGVWENGYDDKFIEEVKAVREGDGFAIKATYVEGGKSVMTIKARGIVVRNHNDGQRLDVDWEKNFAPIRLDFSGGYLSTIHEIKIAEHIKAIFESQAPIKTVSSVSQMTLNTILYGPPGTGKTYNTFKLAVDIISPRSRTEAEIKADYTKLKQEDQIEFITFHQNYSYEDFMVGIKPGVNNATLSFNDHYGIFYKICKRARDNYNASRHVRPFQNTFEAALKSLLAPLEEDVDELELKTISRKRPYKIVDYSDSTIWLQVGSRSNPQQLNVNTLEQLYNETKSFDDIKGLRSYYQSVLAKLKEIKLPLIEPEPEKKFVLIIDEINRANISRVFGELITLIEDDKRIGAAYEMRLTLPNGEKNFGVPPNLYIIGTMNTADKSIALVDIALRRRFEFKPCYPTHSIVSELVKDPVVQRFLLGLNNNVFSKRKSADYLIGHAYLMKVTSSDLERVIKNKILPLLMEYFNNNHKDVSEMFQNTGYVAQYDNSLFDWKITTTTT